MSVRAPYSLTRYVFSVPPLRTFAVALEDNPDSPAHCAGLSARLLQEACKNVALPHPPPWYSPSTIYIEMGRPSRMEAIVKNENEMKHATSIVEDEEVEGTVETLLRGSDVAVSGLQPSLCVRAIRQLTEGVAQQRAARSDAVKEGILERQLARALLRYVEIANL